MLPENQLTDILMSLDRNIHLKTSQGWWASNGLVFYESVKEKDWDFNQMANAVMDSSRLGVPFAITATAKR